MRPPLFEIHPYIASFMDEKRKPEEIVDFILAEARPEVIRAFLLHGVGRAINEVKHQRRTILKKHGTPHVATEPVTYLRLSRRTMKHATTELKGILASWTIRGVQLGVISKKVLLQEAEIADRQAEGQEKNSKFYRSLAQKLRTDESVVADSWTERQVDDLRHSIWGTV